MILHFLFIYFFVSVFLVNFFSKCSLKSISKLSLNLVESLRTQSTWLLLLSLWLLSTWFGTFILCGMLSLSTKFPFFHSYPELSLLKQQKVMQSWSLSYLRPLRMLFRTIKLLTLLVFFTQVINDLIHIER